MNLILDEKRKAGGTATESEVFFNFQTRIAIWAQQGTRTAKCDLMEEPVESNDGSGQGIVMVNLGPTLGDFVLITDPDMYRDMMRDTRNISKTKLYHYAKDWLGIENLLLSGGNTWRTARKLTQPAFHNSVLEQLTSCFNSNADLFVKKCIESPSTDDVYQVVSHYIMKTFLEASLGFEVTEDKELMIDEYLHYFEEYNECYSHRLTSIPLSFDFIYNMSQFGRRAKRAIKYLHNFTGKAISERMRHLMQHEPGGDVNLKGNTRVHLCLADTLIREHRNNPKEVTFEYICRQLDTFAFAGHDTSSCTLRNILFLVAAHPRVQKKLIDEIDEVKEDTSFVTADILGRLAYLDAVIKEGMRVMPAVSAIGRQVEFETKMGNFVLPKGSRILCHFYQLFRDPNQFTDPDKFHPERFLSKDNSTRHPFSFIPFSSGVRNCIGQRFAINELKIFMVKIMKRFELSTQTRMEHIRFSQGLTLTIANKIDMTFKVR